jgi:multiple antibiotic resistance protein
MGSGLADSFGGLFLLVFAAAFPIVNPAGSALIFLDITQHLSRAARERLARSIAVYSFLVLTASLYVGGYLLAFFGISIPVLRVAGGLVVTAAGWRFLQQQDEASDVPDDAQNGQRPSSYNFMSKAFYPLTMPITTGPGTISVMIALGTSQPTTGQLLERIVSIVASVAANATIALIIYVFFAFADRASRLLGNSVTQVMMRLSAFILFCIGIQITWTGAEALLKSVAHG